MRCRTSCKDEAKTGRWRESGEASMHFNNARSVTSMRCEREHNGSEGSLQGECERISGEFRCAPFVKSSSGDGEGRDLEARVRLCDAGAGRSEWYSCMQIHKLRYLPGSPRNGL
jgi:hypothetical protein